MLNQHRPALNNSGFTITLLESLFALVILVIILLSWLGLVLAEVGAFSLARLLAVAMTVLIVGGALWARRVMALSEWIRLFRKSLGIRLDYADMAALALALLLAIVYARPAEWIVGGEDPGVYVNIGINIARTGAIAIQDEALAAINPELAPVLFYRYYGRNAPGGYEGIILPGFFIIDQPSGQVEPQFFHMLPVWQAIFYQIGGIRGALFVTPFFGWLAVIAVYFLGRRLINPYAGLLAMALLGFNISQIWFARNAFADIVVQFFLLSGFWLWACFVDYTGSAMTSDLDKTEQFISALLLLLSAACFGLSHLVKADVFVAPFVVLGGFAYLWLVGGTHRRHSYALILYLVLLGHAIIHSYIFSLSYLSSIGRLLSNYIQLGLKSLIVLGPLALLIAWQRARVVQIWQRLLARYQIALRYIFIICILFLSFYAYFVRPFRAQLGALETQSGGAGQGHVVNWLSFLAKTPQKTYLGTEWVRTFVEEGIVRVGWYMTPLGIWLGIAGFLYWVMEDLICGPKQSSEKSTKSAPFLVGICFSSLLRFYRGAITSHFFWAFKRYVPFVIPGFILLIAFVLYKLWPKRNNSLEKELKPATVVPVVLGCFLLVSYLGGSLRFWGHVEWQGAVEDVAALDAMVSNKSVLLFEGSWAGFRVSLPMQYIYGHESYIILPNLVEDPRLASLLDYWSEAGRSVYWLTPGCYPLNDTVALVKEIAISWPHVPEEYLKLPDRITTFETPFCVYRVGQGE